jgi:tetratricopeptide (TPR) repeat protein
MDRYSARPKSYFRLILHALLTIGISCFGQRAVAQLNLPSFPREDSYTSHTVSINQLQTPAKALRSVIRARQFLLEGRLDKAQEAIAKALKESPACALALDIQGTIHLGTGKLDDAAIEFQNAINADPTIGQAHLGLGMILISRNQFKEALVPLDRAESLLPNSWLAYFEIAIAHLQLGDLDRTLEKLKHAEALAASDREKNSGIGYLRAVVSIKQQKYDAAVTYMEAAIKLDPDGAYAKMAQSRLEELILLRDTGQASLAMNEPQPSSSAQEALMHDSVPHLP